MIAYSLSPVGFIQTFFFTLQFPGDTELSESDIHVLHTARMIEFLEVYK